MSWLDSSPPLVIVVGAGGVGKTTVAAAAGLRSALADVETLVMTFDPSMRLKETLGVGDAARDQIVPVTWPDGSSNVDSTNLDSTNLGSTNRGSTQSEALKLSASLLDAKATFDRLVVAYSKDEADQQRILENRYYQHLAGGLAGILEYMAVERLYEVREEQRFGRIILDTPPTTQALDFLEAPERIVQFLDSGALSVAMKPWFDDRGRLKATKIPGLGRGLEAWLDRLVGIDLLRDMAEFFRAFHPLFSGFRQRARAVQELLKSPETLFVLVTGPDEARVPDALFFARRLRQAGYHLGPVIINRVHPQVAGATPPYDAKDGASILAWQGDRDQRGVAHLQDLLAETPVIVLPQLDTTPSNLEGLSEISRLL